MKKLIAMLLALVFVFTLCACEKEESDTAEKDTGSTLSRAEEKYLGTWHTDNLYSDLTSFRLLPNRKVIWIDYNNLVTDYSDVNYGEWMLDNNRIIIFYGEQRAFILNIDGNQLIYDDNLFTRVSR